MGVVTVRLPQLDGTVAACSSSSASGTSLRGSKTREGSVSILCQAQPLEMRSRKLGWPQDQASVRSAVSFQQPDELCSSKEVVISRQKANGTNNSFHKFSSKSSSLLLQAIEDCYDGVIIDPISLPSEAHDFINALRASLSYWKTQKKKGVWLQLPIVKADFVPLAVKEGFKYHHAEPTHVMMTHWIPESPSTLPPNASHQVGIGAFVMNKYREVLAVQEKNGPLRGSGVWKMPTGLINQAEDLCAGAVREVKEETGVDTEFVEVVGFRHGHNVSFSKSDLYFLCTLRPLSLHINSQDEEIEATKWMPLDEFREQPFYSKSVARKKMLDLCIASFDGQCKGFQADEMQSISLSSPTHYFFHKKC